MASSVYGAVTGMQDAFLTENPDFTHFNDQIERNDPSVLETYILPFDTQDNRISTIPLRGEYISDITLKMSLPGLVNTNDNFWTFIDPPIGYLSIYSSNRQVSPLIQITPANFDINQINNFNLMVPKLAGAGPDFSLIMDTSGNLNVAGNNSSGQLGIGTLSNATAMISYTPSFALPVSKIACGLSHSAVLDASGTLWTCGDNSKGQLGNGISGQVDPVTTFVPVANGNYLDIQCTNYGTLILISGGQVAKTGTNTTGELGADTATYYSFVYLTEVSSVTSISCGPDFTLMATSSAVYSSGNNNVGQLGQASFNSNVIGFTTCSFLSSTPTFPVKIMTGNQYSALTDSTKTKLWVTGIIGMYALSNSTYGKYFNGGHNFFNGDAISAFSTVYNNRDSITISYNSGQVINYNSINSGYTGNFTGVPTSIFSFGTVTLFGNNIYGSLASGLLGSGLGSYTNYYDIIQLPSVVSNYITFYFPFDTGNILLVFDTINVANFFGYDYLDLTVLSNNLYYLELPASSFFKSTLSLRQSGFIQGYDKAVPNTSTYKYPPWNAIIKSVSLYMGKQLIQNIPVEFMKFKKEISNSYKNRPILNLLEGDGTSVVPEYRVFLIDTGLLKNIPIHATKNQDIQLWVDFNPIVNMTLAILVTYVHFANSIDNTDYTIAVPQVNTDFPKNPCTKIFTTNTFQSLEFNGELMFNSDSSNVAPFDTFTNVPLTGNSVVFNGPVNLSRIRDIQVTSPNSNVYYETINILKISGGISGLLFS
jgi:hypothetical protein